jgi:uncharacterized membrane protein
LTTPSSQPVHVGAAIEYGWRKLWENVGPMLLAGLLVLVVTGLVTWFTLAAADNAWVRFLAGVIEFLVGAIVGMGWIRIALLITRGEPVEAADVLRTGRYLVAYIIASVLFGLMFAVGLVLLIIPGIWVLLTFGFFSWIIVNHDVDAIAALQRSADLTKGHKWDLLGFFIVLFLLNILGLLVLVVGVIVTAAISLLATAYVYRRLEGESVDVPTIGPAEA